MVSKTKICIYGSVIEYLEYLYIGSNPVSCFQGFPENRLNSGSPGFLFYQILKGKQTGNQTTLNSTMLSTISCFFLLDFLSK